MFKKSFVYKGIAMAVMAAALMTSLTACGSKSAPVPSEAVSEAAPEESLASAAAGTETSETASGEVVTNLDQIDNTKWQYNSDDNVYYQIGISYCETPADESYESLAVFVPGDYMKATDNGDGTYTCELNTEATVGSCDYTAETAPIVMPINTPGYAAQDALTEYESFTDYTDEGMIYVHAGCRGRDAGAPAGVTDLKAAVRYVRYNSGNIAGDTDKIFTFGMSGGGAQSALMGVTGDSDLYDDYLEAIGAVQGVSDAVAGSMCWCPITSLDSADLAYEWQMGNTRTGLSDEEQKISDGLTEAFAEYINSIGLKDSDGNALTLEESDDGRYQAGTYYEYIKSVVEESLNNFLSDTTFPYDSSSGKEHMAGMGGEGAGGPQGGGAPDGEAPTGGAPDGKSDKADNASTESDTSMENVDFTQVDDISRDSSSSVEGVTISGTYETAQDYIDALNANGEWVKYDADTNTATITSLADFSAAVKQASKSLGAFDQLDEGQGENTLFGYGDGNGAHFDATMQEVLKSINSEYADDYAEDLTTEDSEGHTVDYRINMYSPLYYLLESSEGYGTSNVAKYFRINTGIFQGDTAVSTEANLALALENYGSDVDYSFVWGKEHTMAERTGNSTDNFVSWVNDCVADMESNQ
ncbi:MAG: tannase [Lachnospiraceae bacterium]|nr:tannase [Lachnospiraceae bacterium]